MPQLDGIRVAILATHGVEESELVQPREALVNAHATVEVLSPDGSDIQAMQHDDKSQMLKVNGRIGDRNPDDYHLVVLPGGALNADALRMKEEARDFVRRFEDQEKPIAAICHAPWLLVSAGIVKGHTLTSYSTLQDDIRNAGGEWMDQEVVVDGNWITSRKPSDIPAFNQQMMERLEAMATQPARA